MTQVEGTFKIRRYWLSYDTPMAVLNTLNWRMGDRGSTRRAPYVDIFYYGDSDRDLTLMELRYCEWIDSREEIVYTVTGDDGLG